MRRLSLSHLTSHGKAFSTSIWILSPSRVTTWLLKHLYQRHSFRPIPIPSTVHVRSQNMMFKSFPWVAEELSPDTCIILELPRRPPPWIPLPTKTPENDQSSNCGCRGKERTYAGEEGHEELQFTPIRRSFTNRDKNQRAGKSKHEIVAAFVAHISTVCLPGTFGVELEGITVEASAPPKNKQGKTGVRGTRPEKFKF